VAKDEPATGVRTIAAWDRAESGENDPIMAVQIRLENTELTKMPSGCRTVSWTWPYFWSVTRPLNSAWRLFVHICGARRWLSTRDVDDPGAFMRTGKRANVKSHGDWRADPLQPLRTLLTVRQI
jgi:hypothetical protein